MKKLYFLLASGLLLCCGAARAQNAVVAADGSGDFTSVQAAVNAAPAQTAPDAPRWTIRIKPGVYREKLRVPKDRAALSLRGDAGAAATTVLTFDDSAGRLGADGKELGTGDSYSTRVDADDFEARDLTFENSHPVGGGTGNQALALSMNGDRAVFQNCRFIGRQDTIYLGRGRQFFQNCFIAGQVDFILGAATAWFEKCELHLVAPGISITAASTPADAPFGFVFSNCTVTAPADANWKTHLGRPWRPDASVTYLNTALPAAIAPVGWNNWSNTENEKTARFAEYNSSGNGAAPDARVAWAKQLSPDEAAAMTPEKVLGGWNPAPQLIATNAATTGATATNVPAPIAGEPLFAPARIAALPPAERALWEKYLSKSAQKKSAEQDALAAETKAAGLPAPVAAPSGPVFKLTEKIADSWYGSDEARKIADTITSFQTPAGGWSKGVAYDKGARTPGMSWAMHTGSWYYVGTFDNRATTEEMKLLARVHAATGDEKYARSFRRALQYVLDAQFPNGGWPQVYPLQGGYNDALTYNDDAMVHVLEILQMIIQKKGGTDFLTDAERAQSQNALDAGVRALLDSQVVENGHPTVWCAQHDPLTLAPVAARKFEPASLSGGESLTIVNFLMSLDNPAPAVKTSIESAVAWFKANAIEGLELVRQRAPEADVLVRPNPAAAPLWARFYELGTGRPIFIGRDAIVRYNLSEIERERRTGYSWYLTKPRDLIEKDYPKWQARQSKARA